MTTARRQLINADTTPFYHVTSRCVRRAFLCGQDPLTGQDFSHRQHWIEEKLFSLANIFAIDVAAYAVMSNHYHMVLRIDTDLARSWTLNDIFSHYQKLHHCDSLVQKYLDGRLLTPAELIVLGTLAETYRERLMSISWFMRSMNQSIARKANLEDQVTGRFWEGRFKSQALLDEAAVITCMAYVDLNPVRANIAHTPETSDYTSIQTRLGLNTRHTGTLKQHLLPFLKPNAQYTDKGIPFTKTAYIELVDWTGRCMREDKRGVIPSHLAPIFKRLNLNEHEWLRNTRYFEARFKRVAGTWDVIKLAAQQMSKQWLHGKAPKPKPLRR